ncbi:MAG: hypothetical protein HY286_06365 [Planctomycetes bacterium]|nr:hypothetical protein [Planctomycetota bacterium]
MYELTREWAKWNQQPDPYSEIDRTLAEVRKSKSALKEIVKSRTLMDTVLSKRSAFSQSIIPTLVKYLPSGTSFKATVLFAAFIPPYSFSWGDGSIIINITDSYWRGSADKVLNLLAHEIYHLGFIAHQPGSSATDAHRSGEIIDFIVWRTQNEGMATYVASRCAPPGLLVEDYDLLDDPAQVRAKFDLLRSLIIEASDVDESRIPLVRTKAFQVGDMQRAFFVVGAHMARRIEQINGLDSLVNTVISGPRAFFATYAATKPPAGLSVNLP